MKLVVETKAMLGALAPAARVAARTSIIPILENVKITAKAAGTVAFLCNDLDKTIESECDADVQAAGVTTVPANRLLGLIRSFTPGSQTSLEMTEGSVVVRSGRSRFVLPTLPQEDFPAPKWDEGAADITAPAAVIAEALTATKFAISTEETRYYLNGIFIHAHEGVLRFVTVDGHKLGRFDSKIAAPADMPSVILPRLAVDEVIRLCAAGAGSDCQLSIAQSRISFSVGRVSLVSKTIDGTFPDYQRITPWKFEGSATFDRAQIEPAVSRMTLTENARKATAFLFADDRVTLTSRQDAFEARDEVDSDVDGPPFSLYLNIKYFAETIAALGGETIRAQYSGAGYPLTLTSRENEGRLALIMPTSGVPSA